MRRIPSLFFFAVVLTAVLGAQQPGTAPAQGRGQRPVDPRTAGGGQCSENPVQLHRHAQPADAAQHGLARRDDLDGRARRDEGGQDDHHHLDRRDRAERAVAGARQAQLRAEGELRRDRPQARQRAVRADRAVRPRRRRRAEERPHDHRRHDQHARGDLPGDAHRHRAELQDARLPEHHLHRRQRRQRHRHEDRRRQADRAVERQPRRRAHPRALRLQHGGEAAGRAWA